MGTIDAPLSAEGYARANEAFRQCWSGDRERLLAFTGAHLPQGLASQAQLAVVGFGVGEGAFDEPLIALLRQTAGAVPIAYIAVEPNPAQLAAFEQRFAEAALPQVQFDLRAIPAEEFVPPEGQRFDLVHYIHSLYHMPGHEERLIRESLAMLAPQGQVIVALATERGGIYQMMYRFWNVLNYSRFQHALFGQETLHELLDRTGAHYDYETYPDVYIDVQSCFDPSSELGKDLLNFVLQADMQHVPDEVRQGALEALRELAGPQYRLPHGSGVFAIAPR